MVTKTMEEWHLMSPAERKAHLIEEEKIVYGHDFKKVKGKPQEQGIGSPGRETSNHWAALRKREQMGLEAPGTTDRLMAEAKKKKAD